MYTGLGVSQVPTTNGGGNLEAMAAAETAYRECKALEPILGPCQMRPPASMTTAQVLPPLTSVAPFPWAAVTVLSLFAFLALKG